MWNENQNPKNQIKQTPNLAQILYLSPSLSKLNSTKTIPFIHFYKLKNEIRMNLME